MISMLATLNRLKTLDYAYCYAPELGAFLSLALLQEVHYGNCSEPIYYDSGETVHMEPPFYKQYKSRWSSVPYPSAYRGNNLCPLVCLAFFPRKILQQHVVIIYDTDTVWISEVTRCRSTAPTSSVPLFSWWFLDYFSYCCSLLLTRIMKWSNQLLTNSVLEVEITMLWSCFFLQLIVNSICLGHRQIQ